MKFHGRMTFNLDVRSTASPAVGFFQQSSAERRPNHQNDDMHLLYGKSSTNLRFSTLSAPAGRCEHYVHQQKH